MVSKREVCSIYISTAGQGKFVKILMEYTQAYVRHFIPSNKSKLLLQYEAGMLIYRRLVGNYQKSIGRSGEFPDGLVMHQAVEHYSPPEHEDANPEEYLLV
jgi:hypothetical protein